MKKFFGILGLSLAPRFNADGTPGGGESTPSESLITSQGGDKTPPAATPPATPPPSAEISGWLAKDGAFVKDWTNTLPEDLKPAAATLAKYPNLTELIRGHANLQTLMGKKANAVVIPGEKSSAEEVAAYRKALGIPDTVDGYKLKPEKLPEGLNWSDELAQPFAEIAHRHNIPPAAMNEIISKYVEQQGHSIEAVAQLNREKLNQGAAALRTAWGDKYDENIQFATKAAKTAGVDPRSAGFTDPEVVKAFVRLGQMISEDKLVSSDGGANQAATGKARANKIMTDPSDPLYKDYQGENGAQKQREAQQFIQDLLKNG